MNKDINVAEILKTKEKGTKLYDIVRDIDVYLYNIVGENDEIHCSLEKDGCKILAYSYNGTLPGFVNGKMVLVPSREMRDWEKFQWKKGDILRHNTYAIVIMFDSFINDDYTKFKFNYKLGPEQYDMSSDSTERFTKVSEQETKSYITQIETEYDVKFNNEISEFEKTPAEFKDGDIVVTDSVPSMCYSKCIFILKGDLNTGESRANSYVFFNINNNHISYDVLDTIERDRNIHLATDSEKQQLFSALEKEGKAWDAEKKTIVYLKPKCEFNPFDKVLCRNSKDDTWEADFFARLTRKEIDYTQSDKYLCVGDLWIYCIPYNEETAHLLGTTDEWEGGEG